MTKRTKGEEDRPETDQRLLECFRRMNLDAFWSRSRNTVDGNRKELQRFLKIGWRVSCAILGPPPTRTNEVDFGEAVALAMLLESLESGLHGATKKFSPVRKIRSMVTNILKMRADLERPMRAMRDGPRMRELTELPTDSVWFQAFLAGLRARMGESLRQDMALTPEIVVAVLQQCDEDWVTAESVGDLEAATRTAEIAVFYVLTYAAGLRSFEVPKVVLTSLRHQFEDASDGLPARVGVPLTGVFKARGRVSSNYYYVGPNYV